jgi:antitoxin FitA
LLGNDCSAIIAFIASLTIRNLDEDTKARLRMRAARHKRSMEEEARTLLREALAKPAAASRSLAGAIRKRFSPFHGVQLDLPDRAPIREPLQ